MKKMPKATWFGYTAVLLIVIGFGAANTWSAESSFPDKPLEFVIQAGAGGPSDIFTRIIAKWLAEQKLVTVPMTINNKAGGGGAIANNYMKAKEGSPYYLLHCGGTFITAPLRDATVPGYKDFTPIARLTVEPISLLVPTSSPYKVLKDLVEDGKKRPGEVNIATTAVGGTQHLVALNLEEVTGAKFNYVSFTSTHETSAAALGGHVAAGWLQPALAMDLVKAGKMRILAVSSDERVGSAPNAPTFKEQGYDVVFNSHRGFVAPGKIPEDAKKSLSTIFEKLAQSSEFAKYVEKEGNEVGFLGGDGYRKWLESETALFQRLMRKAGLIK